LYISKIYDFELSTLGDYTADLVTDVSVNVTKAVFI